MRVKYNSKEVDLLARIMRAEAVGEGVFGMKLVGNVVINRVFYNCKPFKHIKTIYDAVYQKNQFEGITIDLFKTKATTVEKNRALECIKHWRAYPAYSALYFQNPGKGKSCNMNWYGVFAGRFKNHCFYDPERKCNL